MSSSVLTRYVCFSGDDPFKLDDNKCFHYQGWVGLKKIGGVKEMDINWGILIGKHSVRVLKVVFLLNSARPSLVHHISCTGFMLEAL